MWIKQSKEDKSEYSKEAIEKNFGPRVNNKRTTPMSLLADKEWDMDNLSDKQVEKPENELDDKVSTQLKEDLAKKLGISENAAEYLKGILHR